MDAVTLAAAVAAANKAAPSALADVGGKTQAPFVIVLSGQSNAVGQDSSGSKTVQPGIYITNSYSNPTALVPAAFGTAPLNLAVGGGTSSTASACYNNPGVAFANALRSSGMIPASRDIVIVYNCAGAQSISDWVDKTPLDLWTPLQTALGVVAAAYPAATIGINYVLWAQGENDNTGTYGSQATYLAAFDRLVAQYQALPQWTAQTRMGVTELGAWSANTQQNRNDALRTLADGARYPFVTFVSGAGLAMGPDNPVPHYSGSSLIELGKRHFRAWGQARIFGQFFGQRTANGSQQAYPNLITVPATTTLTGSTSGTTLTLASAPSAGSLLAGYALIGTGLTFQTVVTQQLTGTPGAAGTYGIFPQPGSPLSSVAMTAGYAIGVDDLRSGAYIDCAGVFTLPSATLAPPVPIIISTISLGSSTVNIYSVSPISMENVGTVANGNPCTLRNNHIYLAVANPANGTWQITSLLPRDGNTRWVYPSSSASATLTLANTQLNHSTWTLNGTAVTATWTFGNEAVFYNNTGQAAATVSSGGTTGFILPDGTTTTTLTLQAGQLAYCIAGTSGTNSLTVYVVALTGTRTMTAKSSAFTAGATPGGDFTYLASGTTTATLPTAVGNTGRYTIKNTGTATVTVATTSAQTIDGAATYSLAAQYKYVTVISDGANWAVVAAG